MHILKYAKNLLPLITARCANENKDTPHSQVLELGASSSPPVGGQLPITRSITIPLHLLSRSNNPAHLRKVAHPLGGTVWDSNTVKTPGPG
eukprot:scaffold243795_cov15-Tisochrysis_lutea.AAC.1